MKLVELLIDDDEELAGIQAVSLVKFPAIETNFVYLSADAQYVFAALEEERRLLVGPALIPDKRILRIDEFTGEQYEVYFTADTIRKAAERYMKEERTNQHTYEHEVPVSDLTVVESWLIEDTTRDKAALYGFKLPEGTWMLSVKVNNEAVWNQVKDDKVRGFSIEGYFVDQVVSAKAIDLAQPCKDCPKDPAVMEQLKALVMEELTPVLTINGVPLFRASREADLYAQLFMSAVGADPVDVAGVRMFAPAGGLDPKKKQP
jgi:hypothetical protein